MKKNVLCLALFFLSVPYAESANWRYDTSIASVEFPNGIPTSKTSRFCLLNESRTIDVGLQGHATSAFVQSESSAWSSFLNAGTHTLDAGCYVHSVGDYTAREEIPTSKITYSVRDSDPNVSLGGVQRLAYTEAGRSLIDKGTKELGSMNGRLLLDVYGLDDKLKVYINGTEVLSLGFNQVNIYEFTQKLKDGENTIEIKAIDKNKGKCWDFGYRIGDGAQWKYGDHYSNSTCRKPFPREDKTMYKMTFKINFRR